MQGPSVAEKKRECEVDFEVKLNVQFNIEFNVELNFEPRSQLGIPICLATSGSVEDSTLNLVYNLADFVNKIAFCLAIWSSAKKCTLEKAGDQSAENRRWESTNHSTSEIMQLL